MMYKKRLIDAHALQDALRTEDGAYALGHSIHRLFCVDEIIDNLPTVDAVEVVHGRWVAVEDKLWNVDFPVVIGWNCSVCGICGHYEHNYCPNCGAKMDGDGNE